MEIFIDRIFILLSPANPTEVPKNNLVFLWNFLIMPFAHRFRMKDLKNLESAGSNEGSNFDRSLASIAKLFTV